MGVRQQSIERFKSGQSSNEKVTKDTKAPVITDGSQMRYSGRVLGGGLMAHMGGGTPMLPSGTHVWKQTTEVRPAGVHYEPRGEFGRMPNTHKTKATGMGMHSSKPGKNALGETMNKVGLNALKGAKKPAKGSFKGNY